MLKCSNCKGKVKRYRVFRNFQPFLLTYVVAVFKVKRLYDIEKIDGPTRKVSFYFLSQSWQCKVDFELPRFVYDNNRVFCSGNNLSYSI